MKKLYYSVFDKQTEIFSPPFLAYSVTQAIRDFTYAVNDKETSLSHHPDDYLLYELGTFDDNAGTLIGYETPLCVTEAAKVVKND